MINRKEVQHIAGLARISIAKAEIEKFQKDLSPVFGYFKKLEKIDVSQTKPTSHPFKIENVTRKDEVKKEPKKLISGFLEIKSVF